MHRQPHYILIKILHLNYYNHLLLFCSYVYNFLTYIKGRVFATRSAGPLPPSGNEAKVNMN